MWEKPQVNTKGFIKLYNHSNSENTRYRNLSAGGASGSRIRYYLLMGVVAGILLIALAIIRGKNSEVFYQYSQWPDRTSRIHNSHSFNHIFGKEDHQTDAIFIRRLQAEGLRSEDYLEGVFCRSIRI